MGDPVARRELGLGCLDAVAVHPAAARPDEHRARLRDQPDAELAALEHEACASVQRTSIVADQVAEQTERNALGITLLDGRSRADDVRAAGHVELGNDPRVRERVSSLARGRQ